MCFQVDPLFPLIPCWLDPFVYQEQRWCTHCEEFETFVFALEAEGGRWGSFLSCGSVEFVAFERTVGA